MSFSIEWENQYKHNAHLSIWPWSDLVSLVVRHLRNITPKTRVLELGCGAGANIPFFKKLGVEYYAVEGSETIVRRLGERFPELERNLVVGDFTKSIPFGGRFDLIFDRGSLTANSSRSIRQCLEMVHGLINAEGMYIGVDWYSTASSDYHIGKPVHDKFTKQGYDAGPLANIGPTHFASKDHLLELLKNFEIVELDHRTIQRHIPANDWRLGSWSFVARPRRSPH
jgi:SAM-dependent methyltransferase